MKKILLIFALLLINITSLLSLDSWSCGGQNFSDVFDVSYNNKYIYYIGYDTSYYIQKVDILNNKNIDIICQYSNIDIIKIKASQDNSYLAVYYNIYFDKIGTDSDFIDLWNINTKIKVCTYKLVEDKTPGCIRFIDGTNKFVVVSSGNLYIYKIISVRLF